MGEARRACRRQPARPVSTARLSTLKEHGWARRIRQPLPYRMAQMDIHPWRRTRSPLKNVGGIREPVVAREWRSRSQSLSYARHATIPAVGLPHWRATVLYEHPDRSAVGTDIGTRRLSDRRAGMHAYEPAREACFGAPQRSARVLGRLGEEGLYRACICQRRATEEGPRLGSAALWP
jgi:hypothetical protein